ncbi:MAG: SHOCT domain-containing protein, partial [Chitinophagales bacterium]
AQEQEETQRELRRQMELEEKRAASGSIQVNSNPTVTSPEPVSPAIITPEPIIEPLATIVEEKKEDDITAALQKLKSLFENQLISREEYDAKKAEVLSRI